jgi:hypothetical protein
MGWGLLSFTESWNGCGDPITSVDQRPDRTAELDYPRGLWVSWMTLQRQQPMLDR